MGVNPVLPIASPWYVAQDLGDGVTRIHEPHVSDLLQANIWHVRGKDRDLIVDCGLGIAPLRPAFPELFSRAPLLVVTHAHLDHMGAAHEFEDVCAHRLERVDDPLPGTLDTERLYSILGLNEASYGPVAPGLQLDAVPEETYDPDSYRLRPAAVSRYVDEGDVIDVGDRRFTVLHLPGHTPGGVGLLDERRGTFFAGDIVYDDAENLLDDCLGADVDDYVATMRRLGELSVDVVHAGHCDSFDELRLKEICANYVRRREATPPPSR